MAVRALGVGIGESSAFVGPAPIDGQFEAGQRTAAARHFGIVAEMVNPYLPLSLGQLRVHDHCGQRRHADVGVEEHVRKGGPARSPSR